MTQEIPGYIHLGPVDDDEKTPIWAVSGLVSEGSAVLMSLVEDELLLKSISYERKKRGDWNLIITSDNDAWSRQNGYPKTLGRRDDLWIYDRVLGVAK